jgi:hypothetical protein
MEWETVWSFDTARYSVRLAVTSEDHDPAGDFCDEQNIEFAREGGWHWFQARVQVVFVDADNPKHSAGVVLGEDYLGGCSYHNLDDFRNGGYFRDMVREAVGAARGKLARIRI